MREAEPPTPQADDRAQTPAPQKPTSEEYAAAKWFSIGFLAVTGFLMMVGIVVIILITYRFASDIMQ